MERGHKLLHAHSLALATTHLFGLVTNLLARLLEHHMHNDTTTSTLLVPSNNGNSMNERGMCFVMSKHNNSAWNLFHAKFGCENEFRPPHCNRVCNFFTIVFSISPSHYIFFNNKKKEIMMIILSSVELWYYFYYCHDFSIELAIQVGARQKEMG